MNQNNKYQINTTLYIKNKIITIVIHSAYTDKQLEFAYYVFLNGITIHQTKYSSNMKFELPIESLGTYRFRIFVKQKNEHYKQAYSIWLDKNIYPHDIFLLDSNNVDKYYNLINQYFEKQSENQKYSDKIGFLFSAALFKGGNIFDFIIQYGYKSISVFSDTNTGDIIYILARLQKAHIKYMISSSQKISVVDLISANTKISYLNETILTELSDDDVVLVADMYSDEKVLRIKKFTQAKILWLDNVIFDFFNHECFLKPLLSIKYANPNTRIIICTNANAKKVKNASSHEKNINNFVDHFNEQIEKGNINDPVFSRNGYDVEYIRDVTMNFKTTINNKGISSFIDRNSKYVNISQGFRITTDIPDKFSNNIYMFGSSVCLGLGTDDSHTVCSCLQRIINENKKYLCVNNMSNYTASDDDKMIFLMEQIKYKDGDIIICMFRQNDRIEMLKKYFPVYNVQYLFDRPHNLGEIFFDDSHFNAIGYQRMSEGIYNFLFKHKNYDDNNLNNNTQMDDKISKTNGLSKEEKNELHKYTYSIKQILMQNRLNIGAVVVNCNPFTLGHRYLIEFAANEVLHLFVFVVEDNRSYFPFTDRQELVKQGLSDLKNVTIIPSGNFIISQRTFDAYSNKENLQDKKIDATLDIELFCSEIAPKLGITIRYAGEEPLDNITRQYNNTMQRILPQYGLDFKVISRKIIDGEVVSASRVRSLLMVKDYKTISKLVPKTTLNYLMDAKHEWNK